MPLNIKISTYSNIMSYYSSNWLYKIKFIPWTLLKRLLKKKSIALALALSSFKGSRNTDVTKRKICRRQDDIFPLFIMLNKKSSHFLKHIFTSFLLSRRVPIELFPIGTKHIFALYLNTRIAWWSSVSNSTSVPLEKGEKAKVNNDHEGSPFLL